MKTLLDFYYKNKDGNLLSEEDSKNLSYVNLFYHDGKTYLSYRDMQCFFSFVESEQELLLMAQKILEHSNAEEDFYQLELSGERMQGDYTIQIHKEVGGRASFQLFYKHNKIGYRIVEFNPLQCYLNLDVLTISGGSNIKKDFVGKGLGRFLYDTIDSVIPYQQIPHGYAGASGGLTDYSENFWKGRRENQAVPVMSDEVIEKNKELDYLRSIIHSSQPFFMFLSNPDLKTSDYLWDEEENIVLKKGFFPNYPAEELKDFSLRDIQRHHLISLKKNIKGYITLDIFKDIIKNDFNNIFTIKNGDIEYEDYYDKNLIMESYKELCPYVPYPDDINIINMHFYNKDEKFYYQKNGEQYNVGIISPLNYSDKNNRNYSYQILKTVDEKGLKTVLDNIENAKSFYSSEDYQNIMLYESSHLIKDEKFYDLYDIGNDRKSRNRIYMGSMENILNGQYIYIENSIFDNESGNIIEKKVLSGDELRKHISPEFEHFFATENVESEILFQSFYKNEKTDIEMNIEAILKKSSFYIDDKNIYFGNGNFKESLSKSEFIQELKKLDVPLPIEYFDFDGDFSTSCYGGYQSKISYDDKKMMLESDGVKNNL